ncbi:hypothetical protein LUCX_176 [Xanthomonas phage vB_XciM_LucasX]|nr:hypothetical protein LUCX_176 [Xanthomonas phage vB_XciM_LucasX]
MHLNKPSDELVLELINQANDRSFTFDQIDIASPTPVDHNGRNTQATVTALGGGYTGTQLIFYNRLDLALALPNNSQDGLELVIPNDGFVDSTEVCDRLNLMFQYQLSPEDVVVEAVDVSVLPATYTLKAATPSLAWIGQKTLTIDTGRPLWVDTFSSLELAGFLPADVSSLTEPVTLYNQNSVLATAQNRLPFDAGYPSPNVSMTSNSELQMELSARRGDGSVSVVPDANSTYTLNVGNESTWSLLVSGKLPAGQVVGDRYVMSLNITCPDNAQAVFQIERVNGVYTLINDDLAVRVPFSYNAADGSAFQMLLEITYLLDAMGELSLANTNANNAPIGTYLIELQARRKNSVTPRLLATMTVNAINTAAAADTSLITEYQNAQELTFSWANLTGWTNTHLTVSNNRVLGNASGSGTSCYAAYPFTVQANESAVLHGEVMAGTGQTSALYFGFSFGEDPINTISTKTGLAGVGGANNTPYAYIGTEFTEGAGVNALDGAAQAAGAYRITVAVDPENISFVVRSADGTKEWSKSIPRSAAPNGGVVTSIRIWNGSTSASTARYLSVLGVRKSFTPFRTKTNAAGTIEGSTERVIHRTVTDGWRIQFPKTMNGNQATPVVMFFHQAQTGDRTDVMTEARWTALRQSLSNKGYILLTADDQGDRWGNRASIRNHANLLRWLRQRVNIGKVFVMGYSMGGLTALNAIANRALGPVAAAALLSPVCDLVAMRDPTFTATIDAMWGSNSAASLTQLSKGFNPVLTSPVKFARIPYIFNVSTGTTDTITPTAVHAAVFEALVRPYAKSTAFNVAGTGHGPSEAWNATWITGLFDANL